MFKFIGKLIGIISLLLLIGTLIILYLGYDSEVIPYEEKPEVDTLDEIIGSDLYNSLDTIAASNYQDNYLVLSLSVDEVNAFIIDIIRQKNPNYLVDGNNTIVEIMGTSFDGIFFDVVDGNLSGKAYFKVANFYKSNIAVEVGVEIDDNNNLLVTFEDLKAGKGIKLTRSMITKLIGLFADYIPETEVVDLENLSISLDIQKYLADLSDNALINDLISAGVYVLEVGEADLQLKIDTSKMINGGVTVKNGVIITPDDVINSFDYQAGLSGSVTISEANFNYLILEEFEDDLASFTTTITIAGKAFSISLSDFYLDLDTLTISTNLHINNCVSEGKLKVELTKVMQDDKLASIDLKVKEVTLGETVFANVEEMLSVVSIPASKLSFEILTLTDFEIIEGSSKVKLTGEIDLIS